MVRKFIVDSVKYWAEEYHIDGFRFDLMGLIDVETMNEIRKAVDTVNREVIMYGEGWDMATCLSKTDVRMAKQVNAKYLDRIALFNDSFRDAVKGSVFLDEEVGYISNNRERQKDIINGILASPEWASTPEQVVNFVSCHDNNTLFDKIEIGNPGISFSEKVKQNKLAALMEFTCQGMILIHAGEELLRTKIDEEGKFISDSVRAGDGVNAIKWENLAKPEYLDVYNYYKGLIAVRKAHPAFRMWDGGMIKKNIRFLMQEEQLVFEIEAKVCGDTAEKILVIYNPSADAAELILPDGVWTVCADEKSVDAEGLYQLEKKVKVAGVSGMILIK